MATVESPTLIGSEYISITPGSKTAPLVPPGGYIASMPRKSISNYMDEFGLKDKFAQVGALLATLAKVTIRPGGDHGRAQAARTARCWAPWPTSRR